jgi:hypothetical protein
VGVPTKLPPPGKRPCSLPASSHAVASKFPHTCGRNQSGKTQVAGIGRVFGTTGCDGEGVEDSLLNGVTYRSEASTRMPMRNLSEHPEQVEPR